jgi:hypothetical protein
MSNLTTKAEEILEVIKSDLPPELETIHDYEYDGKSYPALITFKNESRKKNFLGLKTKKFSKCSEFCFVDYCEEFNGATLKTIETVFHKAKSELIDYTDPEHDFSFLGMIIFTNKMDPGLVKPLKKYNYEIKYKQLQGFGWLVGRIVVVDFGTRKLYFDRNGVTMKSRFEKVQL